jgi:tRNA(fMet)-specific endonuclease VapC
LVIILDSDHCVAVLRGHASLANRLSASEEIAVTAVTVGELVHGARKSARPDENLARLDMLVSALTVLPFDESAARRFGVLKADLERAGASIGDLDLQIASIVLQSDSSLVTHNRRHFERVPGLVIEDWLN